MDFDTTCPACKEEASFGMDMSGVISQINMPNYDVPIQFDNLAIRLKPQPYFEVNRVNQVTFTEQQLLRAVNDANASDEEKKAKTDMYLNKLIELNIDICVNSTQSITTEEGVVVSDSEFIKEYYTLADYKVMRQVQARLAEMNKSMELKPIDVTCSHCQNQYQIPLTFDYANFFA